MKILGIVWHIGLNFKQETSKSDWESKQEGCVEEKNECGWISKKWKAQFNWIWIGFFQFEPMCQTTPLASSIETLDGFVIPNPKELTWWRLCVLSYLNAYTVLSEV